MKYDVGIVIGRFQPLHKGHETIVKKALEVANNVVIVFGGYEGNILRNPFSYKHRDKMLRSILTKEERDRTISFVADDYLYDDDMWKQNLEATITRITNNCLLNKTDIKFCLVGHNKDSSSFYLHMFPKWKFIGVDKYCIGDCVVSSTEMRNSIFSGTSDYEKYCSAMVTEQIKTIINEPEFNRLKENWIFSEEYKNKTKDLEYPPIYTTVDNLVIISNKVLFVKRKSKNGEDSLALPGGFLDHNELLIDGAIRELKEETSIPYDSKYLKNKMLHNQQPLVFDYPFRSSLGRLITNVFIYELKGDALEMIQNGELKPADDAKDLVAISIGNLLSDYMHLHDDHYSICYNLLNKISRIRTY